MKNDTSRVHQLAFTTKTVNTLTNNLKNQIHKSLINVHPNVKDLLSQSENRLKVLRQKGVDLEEKLAQLRQKTALARDQANRIGVGVTLMFNSTLQLRNPEGYFNHCSLTSR